MSDKTYLRIHDSKYQSTFVVGRRAPITLGRSVEDDTHVILECPDSTISRVHGRIEQSGGGLIYIDDSRNGTLVGDAKLKQGSISLAHGAVIRIGHYEVALIEAPREPLIIVETDANLREIARMVLLEVPCP